MRNGLPVEKGVALRLLYATSREASYARNQTLIRALRRYADVEVVAPSGDGQGFERRLVYLWGLIGVVARVLARTLRPVRQHDTLVIGFLAQPLAVVLGPFWRGRIIADAMVSVYDTICCDKQLAAPRSVAGRIARWLDVYLVGRADALIFDTDQHRDYFRTLTARPLPPSCVVPVGSRVLTPPQQSHPESNRLQVVFAGAYIPLQGSSVIVDAARLLTSDPVDFTMIGTGQDYQTVAKLAQREGVANVRFVGWLDQPSLDEWYHRADVILGIFGPTPKTQRVIPNKVFEALSIGRPVITGDTPAIRELFVPGRDVVCCPVNDPRALAEAIRWAAAHRDDMRAIGRAGRTTFEQQASDETLAEAVRPLFAGCAS